MAQASKLGRGLSALLPSDSQKNAENKEIPVNLLHPNPWQPRQDFSEENLTELANSIKSQGIIQPLLVRQLPDESYQIIAGERRYRAAKLAGLSTVPAYVRSFSDDEVMLCALIENLQRENLNPLEEALALKSLRDNLHLTQEAIAEKLGRSRSSIANSLRLLQLSEEAQENLRTGSLSAGHARALLALADTNLAESLRAHVIAKNLSVRETEDLISQWKKTGNPGWVDENSQEQENNEEKKTNQRQKKSEIAKKMQSLISQVMACKTTVSGNEEQGRITITYSSSAELQSILEKIGAEKENIYNDQPNSEEKNEIHEEASASEAEA